MKESWKPIKGYEGYYEVSNLGRVRALSRIVPSVTKDGKPGKRTLKYHIVAQANCSNGYKQVTLSKNGKTRMHRVHRLVAEAFIRNPQGLPEVNHLDETRTNNRADNLEWCTHKYNNNYGTKPMRGERNPMSKLTEGDVKAIRQRRANGDLLKAIAADFGVSTSHVSSLVSGRRWKSE